MIFLGYVAAGVILRYLIGLVITQIILLTPPLGAFSASFTEIVIVLLPLLLAGFLAYPVKRYLLPGRGFIMSWLAVGLLVELLFADRLVTDLANGLMMIFGGSAAVSEFVINVLPFVSLLGMVVFAGFMAKWTIRRQD